MATNRNNVSPNHNDLNSGSWIIFVWAQFAIALTMLAVGVAWLPLQPWERGYVGMAGLLLTGASFTLAKTTRDAHEENRLITRVDDAFIEQLLMDHRADSVYAAPDSPAPSTPAPPNPPAGPRRAVRT